ncbi:MAG: trypsin-like peptidase domain-containing protein [Clostridia bacterium]|nr:trypsin-like peptidase domain-containing protein [Clostridia bacterium]
MARDPGYDNNQYYNDFQFKSYDEILAARRRKGNARKGCMIGFMFVISVVVLSVVIGVMGGTYILERIMQRFTALGEEQEKTDELPEKTDDGQKGGYSIEIEEPDTDTEPLITAYDVSSVVEKSRQSVVGVVSESYSNFSSSGTGTGIVLSEDGYIVTNNHVIQGGDSITVVLEGGENCPAILIGADEHTDIAVLKVQCSDKLIPAEFGDSEKLRSGEPAIVIGNPGGLDLQGTVTSGIISATDRRINVGSNVMSLIQTDASINPGNSGGPLLNKYGQVVGVTSSKISATGYEGLGFAIPVSTVKPIVEELIDNGYVSGRPLVGVSVRTVSQLAGAFYGLPRGMLVDRIAEGSAAMQAGLQQGDIVTHLGGIQIRTVSEACYVRNQYSAGDTISLSFYRNGYVYDISFVLDEQQSESAVWDF